MTASLDALWKAIEQARLLRPEQLEAARSQFAPECDARFVAQKLVADGVLTDWQAAQLLSGKGLMLGSYRLVDRLGQGAMGTVYKAEQWKLRRTVALKVISRRRIANKLAAARFLREIRSIAQLDHPNIVTAYDAGAVGDRYFLAMEYVQGQTLKAWLRERGPLPIDWSCHAIRQVALGLQHAFERGVVHRDIKPSNLLVSSGADHRPLVKILDLGLSRFLSEADTSEAELTQIGQGVGTFDYMAPEQIANAHGADVRADIFALGCTLFEMLAASRPFPGTSEVQRLEARTRKDAVPLRSLRTDAPPQLETILSRMLARDLNCRYATPAEIAAHLAPFASGLAAGSDPQRVKAPPAEPQDTVTDPSLDAFLQEIQERPQQTRPHFLPGRSKRTVPWWKRLFQ